MAEGTENTGLGPVPQAFDPGKMYRVQLDRSFEDQGITYAAGAGQIFSGEFAEVHRDRIIAAREEDA